MTEERGGRGRGEVGEEEVGRTGGGEVEGDKGFQGKEEWRNNRAPVAINMIL